MDPIRLSRIGQGQMRLAVEILTAYGADDYELGARRITEVAAEGGAQALADACLGFAMVASGLLARNADLEEMTRDEILQAIALMAATAELFEG